MKDEEIYNQNRFTLVVYIIESFPIRVKLVPHTSAGSVSSAASLKCHLDLFGFGFN